MNIIKKNLLILIIISLLIIQKSKSITILKNKNILLNFNSLLSTKYSNKNNKNKTKSLSFIINGKKKINNNTIIYGKIKTTLKTNKIKKSKIDNIKTNLFYIGIKNNCLGEINYGKNYENINNILSYTNIFPYNLNNNNIIEINNNLITYKKKINFKKNLPIFKNIKFIFQYKKNNNLNNPINNIIKFSENGWGATYSLKTKYGIELSTSYSLKKYDIKKNIKFKKNILQNNNYIKKNIWSTGIKYNLNKLYLGATYIQGNNLINNLIINKNNNKKDYYFNTIIKYNFKSGFTPILGYTQIKTHNINKNKNLINIEKYFNISTIYKFNKSLIGYINYKINQLNNNDYYNNNIMSLGFIFKF